jgi:RNA polymerase sigma-70 factor (ECF subfamily)
LAISKDNREKKLDEASFEDLFRKEFKGLCFFAINYVKDYTTAKEIVQDAFIGLWEKRDVIDMSKQVKSYLSTSIRNKCLNYLRDNQKYVAEMLDYEGLHVAGGHEQSSHLDAKELGVRIEVAISELPEKCREIFVLSRYEHLKYQEIADKLQISVKTVETQMSKALQHMRVRLAEYLTTIIGFLILIFKNVV